MFTLATQFPKYPPLNYLLDYQHLVLKKLFSEYKFKGIYMNCQHTYGLLFKKLFLYEIFFPLNRLCVLILHRYYRSVSITFT